ncbi:MAG: hypothetical protein WC101_05530 [Candidatus Gracilibacteria bacterium]
MAIDFVTEFKKLQLVTPRLSFFQLNAVNSDYNYNCDGAKNCYLLANACDDEDCMYGRDYYGCKDCNDCDHIRNCTLCYQCLNCGDCYNSDYLQDSLNCNDCRYGYFLKGCRDCVGCVGLKQKQFHIFNEPYTEADYRAKLASLSDAEIRVRFEELKKSVPRLGFLEVNCEDSTGNNIFHCQRVHESYDASECQDSGYLLETKNLKDSWDITVLEKSELCYQVCSAHVLNNCNFCYFCVDSSNLEYCEYMINSHDCFGCISLHRKQYYILNQPYSKEDYFKKVAEIKDQLRAEGLYGQMLIPPTFPRQDTVSVWDRM